MRILPRSSVTIRAIAAAHNAGLKYISEGQPGIRRERRGKSFRYRDVEGKIIRTGPVLERMRRLAIPPAWNGVWICPSEDGHIQAIGRDVRGRKQYRYHADWCATRDAAKFERMMAFGRALPKIRRQVKKDLRARELGRTQVLAAVVSLLEATHIRVGNEEYAKQNHSFGLTTLRDRHVEIRGGNIRFHFLGKSGKSHEIKLHDPKLAKIVRGAQDLPGQELFQYLDEQGTRRKVSSEDVNAYLREIAGEDFSAKDFRTWSGTVLAALTLGELKATSPQSRPTKKNLLGAIEHVAAQLGNTPSICRKCYIHPAVMDGYLAGETIELLSPKLRGASARAGWRLGMEEMAVLTYLRKKLRKKETNLSSLLKRSVARTRRN